MCATKLSIPKPLVGREFTIGQDQAAIKKWVDALPTADSEKTVLMVLPVLIEANRLELDYRLRSHFMGLLAPVMDQVIAPIRQRYHASHSPFSSEKNIKRTELIKRIYQEMGFGYKLIISQVVNATDQESSTFLPGAILHAEYFLSRLLVEHYLLYQPVMGNLWGELNLLYRYAATARINAQPTLMHDGERRTIDQLYLQILLLAAVNPYCLLRGEAEKIYQLMEEWSKGATLDMLPEDWLPQGELAMELSSDQAPVRAKSLDQFADLEEVRLLNYQRIMMVIDEQLKIRKGHEYELQYETLEMRLKKEMLERLRGGWMADRERQCRRTESLAEMVLAVGIKECAAAFNKATGHQGKRGLTLDDYGLIPVEDHWGTAKKKEEAAKASVFKIDDPTDDIWEEKKTLADYIDEAAQRVNSYPITQVDVSDGGFGLKFALDTQLALKVGDIVCLRHAESEEAPWRLGNVRWQWVDNETAALVGVRLLAEQALPFTARAIEGLGQGSAETLGLMIGAEDFAESQAELVLTPAIYQVGTLLRLETYDEVVKVTLTEKVESSSSFSRYKFHLNPAA